MIYNTIEFDSHESTLDFYRNQWHRFIPMVLSFALSLLSQVFSAAAVAPSNSMQFSSLVHLPAAAMFFIVECMWSFVAKENDVRRQTYLHPYSFYAILVNLYVIALIENGVFTLEIILTFVLLSNITALAYTAVIFIAHGRLWQGKRTGELTGYILILFLVGLTNIFHNIPAHPINSELNYLWVLPMAFVVFCFAQVVFLEHLMGEDVEEGDEKTNPPNSPNSLNSLKSPKSPKSPKSLKSLKFTNSVHLLNLGHGAIIVLAILYYAKEMHYTWYGEFSFAESGGKLDRRINFELAEMLATPSYNNLANATGKYLRSDPILHHL